MKGGAGVIAADGRKKGMNVGEGGEWHEGNDQPELGSELEPLRHKDLEWLARLACFARRGCQVAG